MKKKNSRVIESGEGGIMRFERVKHSADGGILTDVLHNEHLNSAFLRRNIGRKSRFR